MDRPLICSSESQLFLKSPSLSVMIAKHTFKMWNKCNSCLHLQSNWDNSFNEWTAPFILTGVDSDVSEDTWNVNIFHHFTDHQSRQKRRGKIRLWSFIPTFTKVRGRDVVREGTKGICIQMSRYLIPHDWVTGGRVRLISFSKRGEKRSLAFSWDMHRNIYCKKQPCTGKGMT